MDVGSDAEPAPTSANSTTTVSEMMETTPSGSNQFPTSSASIGNATRRVAAYPTTARPQVTAAAA
jgi:hypothetical protein